MIEMMKPIYLLADSQLLFYREPQQLWLASLKSWLTATSIRAAYIGASNDDQPEFYALFQAAMSNIGIDDCRHIVADFSLIDQQFIADAQIILLAGGDVAKGWQVFNQLGLATVIKQRYQQGAILIGTSAGAIQLGLAGYLTSSEDRVPKFAPLLQLVPYIIDVHDERANWPRLQKLLRGEIILPANLTINADQLIGIVSGGGLIYYPDQRIEAVRYPLFRPAMLG